MALSARVNSIQTATAAAKLKARTLNITAELRLMTIFAPPPPPTPFARSNALHPRHTQPWPQQSDSFQPKEPACVRVHISAAPSATRAPTSFGELRCGAFTRVFCCAPSTMCATRTPNSGRASLVNRTSGFRTPSLPAHTRFGPILYIATEWMEFESQFQRRSQRKRSALVSITSRHSLWHRQLDRLVVASTSDGTQFYRISVQKLSAERIMLLAKSGAVNCACALV